MNNDPRGIYILNTDPNTDLVTGHIVFFGKGSQPRLLNFTSATLEMIIDRAYLVIDDAKIYRLTNN